MYPDKKLILADKKYLKSINCDLSKAVSLTSPKSKCKECGEEYYKKEKNQVFCSISCKNKAISSKNYIKMNNSQSHKRPYYGSQKGDKNNSAKLKEQDVVEIFNLNKSGKTLKQISELKNASIGNIGNILKGRSWKHIHKEYA